MPRSVFVLAVVPAAAAMVAVAVWLMPSHGRLLVGGVNILPWILPGVMTLAFAEGVVLRVTARPHDWRNWFVSSGDAMIRQLVNLIPLSLVGPVFALAWTHRLSTIPLGRWWSFALLLIGQEFCYYWLHRTAHHVRWFWASHAVHHSSNDYTLAAAYRLGWTSKLSGEAIFNTPLIWLGFRPDAVAATLLFNLLYQFWLHTELVPRLGWLEWVLNTPAHHRVHHAANDVYRDKNFGGTLIVCDRLFGTFVRERADMPCRYGLVRPLVSCNPGFIALHEWAAMARDVWRARTWRERLGHAFGPPGWAPRWRNATAVPGLSPSCRPAPEPAAPEGSSAPG
jgi:sterol desaturase/sphingolipid hydroxylase (fatty acid hydroxylase superfamily)